MQLSDRLQAVASMVTENSRLADVGTDHGYIPIYLCEMGKIPSAIAMDVKKGPLLRAKMNIERYHMQEKIRTRLSDGFTAMLWYFASGTGRFNISAVLISATSLNIAISSGRL